MGKRQALQCLHSVGVTFTTYVSATVWWTVRVLSGDRVPLRTLSPVLYNRPKSTSINIWRINEGKKESKEGEAKEKEESNEFELQRVMSIISSSFPSFLLCCLLSACSCDLRGWLFDQISSSSCLHASIPKTPPSRARDGRGGGVISPSTSISVKRQQGALRRLLDQSIVEQLESKITNHQNIFILHTKNLISIKSYWFQTDSISQIKMPFFDVII
jgi:hypothetical protein